MWRILYPPYGCCNRKDGRKVTFSRFRLRILVFRLHGFPGLGSSWGGDGSAKFALERGGRRGGQHSPSYPGGYSKYSENSENDWDAYEPRDHCGASRESHEIPDHDKNGYHENQSPVRLVFGQSYECPQRVRYLAPYIKSLTPANEGHNCL